MPRNRGQSRRHARHGTQNRHFPRMRTPRDGRRLAWHRQALALHARTMQVRVPRAAFHRIAGRRADACVRAQTWDRARRLAARFAPRRVHAVRLDERLATTASRLASTHRRRPHGRIPPRAHRPCVQVAHHVAHVVHRRNHVVRRFAAAVPHRVEPRLGLAWDGVLRPAKSPRACPARRAKRVPLACPVPLARPVLLAKRVPRDPLGPGIEPIPPVWMPRRVPTAVPFRCSRQVART